MDTFKYRRRVTALEIMGIEVKLNIIKLEKSKY